MKNVLLVTIIGIFSVSSALLVKNVTYKNNDSYNIFEEEKKIEQVEEVLMKTDKIYLAVNGQEKLEYTIKASGEPELQIIYNSEDETVCAIDENAIIHAIKPGSTKINVHVNGKTASSTVIVTDLITTIPDEPDSEKELITGKTYTQEENDLLEAILNDRVQQAGYQTRAGVVAAARFIGLEFPYRIPYFSENGRLNTYGYTTYADGEGRYYHKGLLLHESRFAQLDKSLYGPATWGTYIYCTPSKGKRANGFDCSGFITWIVYNGGFEPGDVGAGVSDGIPDMTDLGEKKNLKDSIQNNELKAGDLLSGKGSDGGHIALIAGITEDKYYVAESLWVGTGYFGAIIRTYEHDKLSNHFYWHIDMDEFYGKDGNYTAYWK